MLGDIRDVRLLYVKGALFLALGLFASAILLVKHPGMEVALLLGVAVWAFARAYYFAFYVIEHYADPDYKFAGLGSFVRYVLDRRRRS